MVNDFVSQNPKKKNTRQDKTNMFEGARLKL